MVLPKIVLSPSTFGLGQWISLPRRNGLMDEINLAYFFLLGQLLGQLKQANLALVNRSALDHGEWIAFVNVDNLLKPDEFAGILPDTARIAKEVRKLIEPTARNPTKENGIGYSARVAALSQQIAKFENVLESECRRLFTYHVPDVGAYSTASLIEKSESHLSKQAQGILTKEELKDFKQAGECLAFGLYTACGFHAMRALEAEARRYHMVVIGASSQVDWTLDRLINGNRGQQQFGLRDQWKKEGRRDDSPLVLVMSLLSTITHIYRNPIMHQEMTLDPEQAKQVFNVSSIAINAMVSDRIQRGPNGRKVQP